MSKYHKRVHIEINVGGIAAEKEKLSETFGQPFVERLHSIVSTSSLVLILNVMMMK